MWQKGHISGVPVGHFSAPTVVYKLAWQIISGMDTAEKKEKVKVEQFGANKRKNKTKKIIATHYVTSPSSQCYMCLQAKCACSFDNAVAQNYLVSYKLQ